MGIDYQTLVDSTLEHLRELKAQGHRFVSIAPATLQQLKEAAKSSAPKTIGRPVVTPSPARSPSPGPAPLKRPVPSTPVQEKSGEIRAPNPAPTIQQPVSSKVLTPEAKAEAFASLRKQVLACVKCPNLVSARNNVVFGVGDINARLLFVGEAPGADEDMQGEPFVGAAGQLLTKIIHAMGLTRQTVYIGNILKCRPDTPGKSFGNRPPTSDEMKTCIPWLEQQIDLIKPEVMVALGKTAVEGLLGLGGITQLRGKWQTYRGIPVMPTFHPSYLLRNAAITEKRKVWEDMLQVMTRLGMPISAKQQNYFLKA